MNLVKVKRTDFLLIACSLFLVSLAFFAFSLTMIAFFQLGLGIVLLVIYLVDRRKDGDRATKGEAGEEEDDVR